MLGHLLTLVKGGLYELSLGKPRSPRWPALERLTRKQHPTCAACGGKARLAVHHVQPFHLFPRLELESTNLIVLCMAMGKECHYRLGHPNGWSSWNPLVEEDAAEVLAHPERRELVLSRAKTGLKK